jgi:hypothetical protein
MEIATTGEYICTNFNPVINEVYVLTVVHNGATYTATERLKSVSAITKIVQNNEGGFTGKNIEIKTFYNDPADESNYYLYKYSDSSKPIIKYYADEDTFFQGNEFFSISQNDDLKIGDKVTVSHYGISKEYYNYINTSQYFWRKWRWSFQSPPATVRGNILIQLRR